MKDDAEPDRGVGAGFGAARLVARALALFLFTSSTRSFKLFLISSSRRFVASFRLTRSVALSLLLRLSCDISRWRLVHIDVKFKI